MVEMSLIMDLEISDAAVRLYCFISSYSNNKNGYCYLTHVEIQKILKVSRAQFYRNLQILINKRYIIKVIKNNRVYLQPTINRFMEKREKLKKSKIEPDWLDKEIEPEFLTEEEIIELEKKMCVMSEK